MVVEYKPSHKLSVFNIRAGLLRADKESMNIPEDVINRIAIRTKPDEKFVLYLPHEQANVPLCEARNPTWPELASIHQPNDVNFGLEDKIFSE
jgi:hypothetical protein